MGFRTCPRCSEPLHHGHPSCPVCDVSLSHIDSTFGSRRVRVERLIDASRRIQPDEFDQLQTRLRRFEQDFPQLFFAIYIADLPETTSLRELGFWLINRAIFDSSRSNDSAILLCINNQTLSASLSLGYVPEQFLGEDALKSVLDRAVPYLSERQYGRMIASCLNSVTWWLRQPLGIA